MGADLLDERRVVEELTRAAHECGLEPEESERTIHSGLEEGKKRPRELPSQQDWKEAVKQAITYMSECCDGARTKDGVGFNKFDTDFCKDLATRITEGRTIIDKEELKAAFGRLQKYKKQLASAGISLPSTISECNTKDSMATLIVKQIIESGAELWHSNDGKPHITFKLNDHKEHHPLGSEAAKNLLSKMFYEVEQKIPSTQAINDALNLLKGKAIYEGPEYPVYVRVAPHNNNVYVDLGNSRWEAVEIGPQGWAIVTDSPVRFRRPKNMQPLPTPERGGSWEELHQLLGIHNKKDFILIVGWLIQAYGSRGPYAHLVLTGEQGSGKSGLSKTLKTLVDPSLTMLRRPPKNEKDLMIAAQEERVIAYDNLSGLRADLSDAICVLSTGGSLAGRKLYTDDEEAFLVASRPVILNGIDAIATRGDLQDRSITIDLPRIPDKERMRDSEFTAKLEHLHPRILGLILDATAMGIMREKEVDIPNLPRMADFAAWVVACEPALPWEEGEFLKVYRQAIDDQMVDLVESDPFANAVIKLARDVGRYETTPTRLWKLLINREGINDNHPPHGWPKSANGLTNKLRRIAKPLRKLGIEIESDRSSSSRVIRIRPPYPWNDGCNDNNDDIMTTTDQQQVTAMTAMTTHNQLSLEKCN